MELIEVLISLLFFYHVENLKKAIIILNERFNEAIILFIKPDKIFE